MTTQQPPLNPTIAAASATPGPATPVKRLSLKKNFSWAFAGNAVYQACQWGMLVVLAKLTSAEEVGRFALALAICTPITVFLSLNLRAVQVTDADDENTFGQFLALRILTVAAALVIIAGIALVSGYPLHTAGVIFVVGLSQSVMMTREVFQSFMQKHERMDKVAVSQALAGVLSLGSLGLTVYLTQDLLAGVIAMFLARLASFGIWDLATVGYLLRRLDLTGPAAAMRPQFNFGILGKLAWLALPLGLMASLTNLVTMIPQYFVEGKLGTQALGYFAALAALPRAGQMVVAAAGTSALPRLSRYFADRDPKFIALSVKMALVGLSIGLLGLAIAWLGGKPLITLIFTVEYAEYYHLFLWLMVYGTVAYIAACIGYPLHATRRFWFQPAMFIVIIAVTAVACWLLIPRFGLVGAALAMIAARAVQIPVAAGIVLWVRSRSIRSEKDFSKGSIRSADRELVSCSH